MNDHYIEASQSYESDAREGDRERAYERKELHDVHEPTTYERANPLLKTLMGKDFARFFKEEQYHDHYQDNLI